MTEYVDSVGRVPRGVTEISNAQRLQLVLLLALVRQMGGRAEVFGMGTPEGIDELLRDYELKVGGSGTGSIILEVVRKT